MSAPQCRTAGLPAPHCWLARWQWDARGCKESIEVRNSAPTTPAWLAGAPGLEPGTLCLEGRCSIQLSYAPATLFIVEHSQIVRCARVYVEWRSGGGWLDGALRRMALSLPFGQYQRLTGSGSAMPAALIDPAIEAQSQGLLAQVARLADLRPGGAPRLLQ